MYFSVEKQIKKYISASQLPYFFFQMSTISIIIYENNIINNSDALLHNNAGWTFVNI